EARLAPRDAEELHEALLEAVILPPEPGFAPWFAALVTEGRAARVETPAGLRWLAVERRPLVEALFPGAPIDPDAALPGAAADGTADREAAATTAVRGHLAQLGPVTVAELAAALGLEPAAVT